MRAISIVCFLPALHTCIALLPVPPRQGTINSLSWHTDGQHQASLRRLGSDHDDGHHQLLLPVSSKCCTALYSRTRSTRKRRRRRRPRHGVDMDNDDLDDCLLLDRDDIDHQGLAKSIDAEYAAEEAKMNLSCEYNKNNVYV